MSGLENIEGRIAVITGGGSGIGAGIGKALAARGATVVVADVEQEAIDRAVADFAVAGIVTDVSKKGSVDALAAEILARYGRIDILVNNAGVGPAAPISAMTHGDWEWLIGVNLWGVINGVTAFLPHLKSNPDGGYIVNTSSIGGLSADLPGLGGYAVTKFGVLALTEALAGELGQEGSGVGVSVLLPGTVRTNIKNASRNRPDQLGEGALQDIDLESLPGADVRWLEPEQVGEIVVDAIRSGTFYILTHPESWPIVEARQARIQAAFETALAGDR